MLKADYVNCFRKMFSSQLYLFFFLLTLFFLSFIWLKFLENKTVVKTVNFTLRQEFSADYLCKNKFFGRFSIAFHPFII